MIKYTSWSAIDKIYLLSGLTCEGGQGVTTTYAGQ